MLFCAAVLIVGRQQSGERAGDSNFIAGQAAAIVRLRSGTQLPSSSCRHGGEQAGSPYNCISRCTFARPKDEWSKRSQVGAASLFSRLPTMGCKLVGGERALERVPGRRRVLVPAVRPTLGIVLVASHSRHAVIRSCILMRFNLISCARAHRQPDCS